MTDEKPLLTRWTGAAAGFFVGVFDTLTLKWVGEAVPLWVSAFFASSFVTLGFLLGWALESRARERAQAARLAAQAKELAHAQMRMAHSEKIASLGQLASTMAHELRNPLAIIRSTVQNLKETLPADAEAEQSCRFVLEEIDRLARVTSSIVRFARPLSVSRQPIAAKELFGRAVALSERLLASRPLRLEPHFGAHEAVLDLDADLICQAILGLVDNAARSSPDGASIRLSLDATGDQIVIRVEDSGPGIGPELREKVFEPFFTTRSDGTGLGLPIVRQIANAHGGSISVGERPGGGARFELRLPGGTGAELAA